VTGSGMRKQRLQTLLISAKSSLILLRLKLKAVSNQKHAILVVRD
jgi:hypothetical protein